MAGQELWEWLDKLLENGDSCTLGSARDPLDVIAEHEEEMIRTHGCNLNGVYWKE